MPAQAIKVAFNSIGDTVGNVFGASRIRLIPNIPGARFQVTYLSTCEENDDLIEEVFVGAANPVEQSPVSNADQFPKSPDDVVTTFSANPGEEITVRVTANSALATYTGKLVVTRVR